MTATVEPVAAPPATRKIFIQLGRAGDILNVLPLAALEYRKTGCKPWFMVAADYASLLDGVSYVERVVFEGPFEDVIFALLQARRMTDNICLTQIYGRGIVNGQLCFSFARESWWAAGARVPWGSLPLTIDRRSRDREALLRVDVLGSNVGKKIILVATGGTSSPFPYGPMILAKLRASAPPDTAVIDLGPVKAPRFFDLLGLFDRAAVLVTVDTGHLHLAHASAVPVVALVTRDPSPWHGSPWRPNHVARFFYDEFPRCIEPFLNITFRVSRGAWRPAKIVHVWADWRTGDPAKDLRGRCDVAQASWETEYETGRWVPAEMTYAHARRSGTDLGDPHSVPYVHDVIEHGVAQTTGVDDIICLTNADIGFTPGLTGKILEVVSRHGAAFSHRRDFEKIEAPFFSEAQVGRGKWYPGSDLFCFTVAWWQAHKLELADYVLGREHWDEVLRQLVKYHQGGALLAACWHEWHVSFWCDKERWTLPGNVHNAKLKAQWFKETGFVAEDFRYFRTVETGPVHPDTPK